MAGYCPRFQGQQFELNSVKRINNDAAAKAQIWRTEFGKSQIAPSAMLSESLRC